MQREASGASPSVYQFFAKIILRSTPHAADGSQKDAGRYRSLGGTRNVRHMVTCPPLAGAMSTKHCVFPKVMAARMRY